MMNKPLYISFILFISCLSFTFSIEDGKSIQTHRQEKPINTIGDTTSIWTEEDLAILKTLWIGNLPPLKPDISNRYADNEKAADLGHLLFFETQLSKNGKVACVSCHRPETYFTDTLTQSKGTGMTLRHSPSLVGVAYNDWFYWDGRRDNHWSQALNALEAEGEHESNRLQIVQTVLKNDTYRSLYQSVFGDLPKDLSAYKQAASPRGSAIEKQAWANIAKEKATEINRAFANIGKALAAYQRKLLPAPTRFDLYVADVLEAHKTHKNTPPQSKTLNEEEIRGLKLFINPQSSCLNCHNGPLMTNQGFHNIGLPDKTKGFPDLGRVFGIQAAMLDEFSCKSIYSDCQAKDCTEWRYLNLEHIGEKTFKVPSLRNVSRTAPYMHDGRFNTLKEVLEHYKNVSVEKLGSRELLPLRASIEEIAALIAFLKTLDSDIKADEKWLKSKK